MKKFSYKYESIKKVKLAFEKKTQKEAAEIELMIKSVKEEIEALKEEKQIEKSKMLSKNSLKASEVQFLNNFERVMNTKIITCEKKIVQLQKQLQEKIEELKQKSMELKIFETLEEKHFDQYKIELNKYERKEFDEIAGVKSQKDKN